jgi:uncharacterized protein (UPF0332 family)
MNPDDFLELAQRLAAGPGEAELRSAVSRAYYGLFHAARILVAACEVTTPESAEAHTKVCLCLQNSGHPQLEGAGRKLASFRNIRNRADYQLTDRRFNSGAFVTIQMSIARDIAAAIHSAHADIPSFKTALRIYARDVLKLPVRGTDS